jgi:hypothetical protein
MKTTLSNCLSSFNHGLIESPLSLTPRLSARCTLGLCATANRFQRFRNSLPSTERSSTFLRLRLCGFASLRQNRTTLFHHGSIEYPIMPRAILSITKASGIGVNAKAIAYLGQVPRSRFRFNSTNGRTINAPSPTSKMKAIHPIGLMRAPAGTRKNCKVKRKLSRLARMAIQSGKRELIGSVASGSVCWSSMVFVPQRAAGRTASHTPTLRRRRRPMEYNSPAMTQPIAILKKVDAETTPHKNKAPAARVATFHAKSAIRSQPDCG